MDPHAVRIIISIDLSRLSDKQQAALLQLSQYGSLAAATGQSNYFPGKPQETVASPHAQ
jgi:hypothetical protein